MTPQSIIIAASVVGLSLNTLAIFGIAWRGGRLLGRLEGNMENITEGLERLSSVVAALEQRVGHLEGRK